MDKQYKYAQRAIKSATKRRATNKRRKSRNALNQNRGAFSPSKKAPK